MYVAPSILRSSDQLQSAQITSGVHFFGACDLLRGASSALTPLSSIGQNLQVRTAALFLTTYLIRLFFLQTHGN